MDKNNINIASEILYNSRINLINLEKLPNQCIPSNKEEAYTIQDKLIKFYKSNNQNTYVIGKKIGCTNKAAQIQLNINDSFFGNMFSKNISKSIKICEKININFSTIISFYNRYSLS